MYEKYDYIKETIRIIAFTIVRIFIILEQKYTSFKSTFIKDKLLLRFWFLPTHQNALRQVFVIYEG